MASKDEVLGKLLQGDRKAAVELIRAEALAKGEAASLADQILLARMSGDLAGAVELALRWIEEEPRDVMPVLSLAETFLLGKELSTALTVLEQARLVDGDHPMYFRLVCLAATAAGAFTAAHGAAFCAWIQRLPELILRDLRAQAVCRSLEDSAGAYPREENTDPRWLHLLGKPWHPEKRPVRLAWDEVDGAVWIYNQDLLEAALAASVAGSGVRWTDFPEAAPIVEERLRLIANLDVEEREIEPWMCAPWQGIYLPASLTQYGLEPGRPAARAGQDAMVTVVQTPAGRVETALVSGPAGRGSEGWARAETVATVQLLSRLLAPAFFGRVTLTGPDPRISQAFAWLTSGLPKGVRRARRRSAAGR